MAMTPFRVIQGHRFWYQSRPPSGRRISELAAEFLSAEYQLEKIRLAESAAEFLPP